MTSCRAFPALILLAACTGVGAHDSGLAVATIDTLPSGAISVMSPGPTAWADTNGWRLVEDGRITGTDRAPSMLTQPYDVAVDGAGRVYVAMGSPAAIKVYDRDGEYVRSIGRDGEGPGEFRSAMITILHDTLVVQDYQLRRLSLFDTAGQYLTSWRSACCMRHSVRSDAAGLIYVAAMGSYNPDLSRIQYSMIRYRLNGTVVDTLRLPESPPIPGVEVSSEGHRGYFYLPDTPQTAYTAAPAGGVLYGWSGRYQLVESRTGGDTVRVLGRAWTPMPIREAKREALLKMMTEDNAAVAAQVKLSDMPETEPAFGWWIATDGRGDIWLSQPAGTDTLASHFDVFDSTGVYLGAVRGPLSARDPELWIGDEAYALTETGEGLPEVVRFRIERGPRLSSNGR
ncbi:MAG TPA: 6-bladed beta-propeller [Nitrococcus sp.]|nr:6-bladed beta-propeller [Nitrococcus sp.]